MSLRMRKLLCMIQMVNKCWELDLIQHHGRKVFNLNDFASDMKFEKLSVGEYTYKIYAHDIRGYTAIVEKVFSVGSSSTTSGTISKIEGTHVCDSMTGTPYTWDSGIIKKIPSCTETGLKEYTCMECKKTKNTVIPCDRA